jgi:hypothetical protein
MSDIADLFAKDPLALTREDLSLIIARYREARTQFNLGAKQAGSTKKIKEAKPKITNLDDIINYIPLKE